MKEQMIIVGKILKAHGIKGELKILPLTDFPQKRFQPGNSLFVDKGNNELFSFTIEKSKPFANNFFLMKMNGIDSRENAEQYCGCYLKIKESDIANLEDGRYYIFQIQGLRVFEENGEYLGEIAEILQTGSNDVYIIKAENGNELLIPSLKNVIKKIDLDNRKMIVNLPAGLR